LQYIETICSALGNSIPILKDIGIFTGFFFTSVGLISVAFLGGRLSYRCVDKEGKIYNEDLVCAPNRNQCPKDYTCKDVHINPDKGTISFDNVLISFLNIFQVYKLFFFIFLFIYFKIELMHIHTYIIL